MTTFLKGQRGQQGTEKKRHVKSAANPGGILYQTLKNEIIHML